MVCNARRSDHVQPFFMMHVRRDTIFLNISTCHDGDPNDGDIVDVISHAIMLQCSCRFLTNAHIIKKSQHMYDVLLLFMSYFTVNSIIILILVLSLLMPYCSYCFYQQN
jgi:hypothetical protein